MDIFIVWLLISFAGIKPFFANAAGSTVGILFVFFTSLYKIFENNGKLIVVKLAVYIVYSIFLILIISFLVQYLSDNAVFNNISKYFIAWLMQVHVALVAKIVLTPLSLILNFFVVKNIIEKIKF
ncbi:MAG: hypothetical protein FWG57_06555 [Endomicrobia bacterium]|jgi:putative flippase GtrA|nr:hypothetical protein [Endomicrobiia bacterium]